MQCDKNVPALKTVTGKDNIRKPVGELLGLPNLSISWTPTKVEVAKSGDLAYIRDLPAVLYRPQRKGDG